MKFAYIIRGTLICVTILIAIIVIAPFLPTISMGKLPAPNISPLWGWVTSLEKFDIGASLLALIATLWAYQIYVGEEGKVETAIRVIKSTAWLAIIILLLSSELAAYWGKGIKTWFENVQKGSMAEGTNDPNFAAGALFSGGSVLNGRNRYLTKDPNGATSTLTTVSAVITQELKRGEWCIYYEAVNPSHHKGVYYTAHQAVGGSRFRRMFLATDAGAGMKLRIDYVRHGQYSKFGQKCNAKRSSK